MFAIIQIGSTQYKVAEGDVIKPLRLKEEEGKTIKLDKVLLYSKDADVRVGQPFLKDVKVEAKVIKQQLGRKVTSLKYRRRKNSETKTRHRSKLTVLNITKISG